MSTVYRVQYIYVLVYKSKEATEKWAEYIDTLEHHLIDNHTPNDTVQMIASCLHRWRDNTGQIPPSSSTSLSSAIIAQNIIGRQEFIKGCMSAEWKANASTFLTIKQSPRRWTALQVK